MSAWVNLARYSSNKGQGLCLNSLITTLGLDSISHLKTSDYQSDAHNVKLSSELIDNRKEFIIKAQKNVLDIVAWLCSRQSGLVRYGKCLIHVNVWSSDCACYVAIFYWTVQAENKLKSVSTFGYTVRFMQFNGSIAFSPVNMSSSVIDLLLKPCCFHHDRRKFVPFQLVNVGSFRLIYDITNPEKIETAN